MVSAAIKGDFEEAGHCDAVFADQWRLFRAHGSLRLMYAAANMLGLTDAQLPKPLLSFDEGFRAALAKASPR
jgi:4-hydroxy-tetrahydrodipicolinate synthase